MQSNSSVVVCMVIEFLSQVLGMAPENDPPEKQPSPASAKPAIASCRKKKSEEATFLEDLKDHVDEFIHASMDEHKTCFKKTIQKVDSKTISWKQFCT